MVNKISSYMFKISGQKMTTFITCDRKIKKQPWLCSVWCKSKMEQNACKLLSKELHTYSPGKPQFGLPCHLNQATNYKPCIPVVGSFNHILQLWLQSYACFPGNQPSGTSIQLYIHRVALLKYQGSCTLCRKKISLSKSHLVIWKCEMMGDGNLSTVLQKCLLSEDLFSSLIE